MKQMLHNIGQGLYANPSFSKHEVERRFLDPPGFLSTSNQLNLEAQRFLMH